ncbi:von Willebrand factor type A domain-containing protein [Aspergillus pseudoustus]|uniref:von Willebrand factor type A domain-containing protein n=1 Tax=Aspergillus pseudoustus TaxID=1810923 RepID=A0ABR4JAA6_9EURO
MAIVPGIVFSAVEPPNPYDDDASWGWVPTNPRRNPLHQSVYVAKRVRDGAHPPPEPSPAFSPSPYQPAPEKPQTWQAMLQPFSVALVINVTQGLAKAVVTQTFRNDAPTNIEKATYQFPIPHESSVVDFKCHVGATKILQGHVKPKPEARATFDDAVKGGYSAGLVEQNSPEVFRTELGNIPAHTTVEVKLSFIFFLKYTLSDDVTTTVLTIPTFIAPRYGNSGFELGETGPQRNTRLSVNIDILTSTEIRDIRSDTHQVSVNRGSYQRQCRRWADFVAGAPPPETTSASVRLDGDPACLDRDFILIISAHPAVEEELPHASLEFHPDSKESSALMLEIPPRFMLRDQKPVEDTEVIFLADRSGSMLDKITGLKSSLEFFLRGLPKSRFNLYCFGSNYTSLWPASRQYNDDTLNEALRYVSRFTNDMGGTDLLPALEALVKSRGQGSLDVIVLTDGQVWQLQKTIDFVRRTHTESEGAVRFFSMGIGNAVSVKLVEGIANAGGGYAEIIPLASSEGWEARMVAVLKAAMTGHVSNIAIEVDGIDIHNKGDTDMPPLLQISPGNISSLSPFSRNRIFILAETHKLSPQSVIKIKRRSIGGQETAVPVQLHVLEEQDLTLHQFASSALLSDLHEGRSWVQRDGRIALGSSQENELTQKEGERLGCRYSLVSKWTSFVAVETVTESETDKSVPESLEYATSISSDTTISGVEQLDTKDIDLLAPRPHPGTLKSFSWKRNKQAGAGRLTLRISEDNDARHSTVAGRDTQGLPSLSFDSFQSARSSSPVMQSPQTRMLQPSKDFVLVGPKDTFDDPDDAPMPTHSRKPIEVVSTDTPISERRKEVNRNRPKKMPGRGRGLKFTHRVLRFQKSNGGFEIPQDEAEGVLGSKLRSIMEGLRAKGVEYDLAVTVAIVVWLENKQAQDRSLWSRMVEKAREYIQSQLENGNAADDRRSLLDIAQEMLYAKEEEKEEGQTQEEKIEDLNANEAEDESKTLAKRTLLSTLF